MTITTTTTVIVPAESYDLVSLDDVKNDIVITDNESDDYLQRVISSVSSSISAYCNRVFVVETVEDVIDIYLNGVRALQLARWPIVAMTSVDESGSALIEGVDYRVDHNRGQLLRIGSDNRITSWAASPVTVTYSAGYDPIPPDLQDATTRVVQSLNFSRTRDPSIRSESALSGLYSYSLFGSSGSGGTSAGDPAQVESLLNSYRVPTIT